MKRSRNTAIILNVLFGPWGWIYTWRLDNWKFVLGMVVAIITFLMLGFPAWLWAVIDAILKKQEDLDNAYK